jgi:uncharacterized protein YlxW (UPF0749 family)
VTAAASPTLPRRSGLAGGRSVALVAAILGVLAVGQLRGQAGAPALSNLSAQELTQLIANLNARNDQLRGEIADLNRQAAALQETRARGATTVDQLRSDLARIRSWTGTLAVTGTGVVISVSGPIGGDGVEDLLNELRNAGAEAVSVGGVRIVAGIVVAGAPGALSLENTELGDAFEIRAIGSPQILTGTLTRTGGVIAQIGAAYPDARINVTPVDTLSLPATTRSLTPTDARPRL